MKRLIGIVLTLVLCLGITGCGETTTNIPQSTPTFTPIVTPTVPPTAEPTVAPVPTKTATPTNPTVKSTKTEDTENTTYGEITGREKIEFYTYAQTIIKDYVSSPKFAGSKDEYKVIKTLNRYKVESWVEYKNSSGGTVKNNFIVIYEMKNNGEYFEPQTVEIGKVKFK